MVSHNKLKKILLATLATTTICLPKVYAAEDVTPAETSNNEITINETSYTIHNNSNNNDDENADDDNDAVLDIIKNLDEDSTGTETYGMIYGGGSESNTEASENNTITFEGGTANGIFGGMSISGNVSNNTITINSGTITGGVIGGVTFFPYDSTAKAGDIFGNKIIVKGGTIANVSGGEVSYTYPNTGEYTFDTSRIGGNVFNNTVEIKGGTITNVIGGSALTGQAHDNTISISGGTISGQIIGGLVRKPVSSSYATGNVINISGSPNLSGATIIGGLLGTESSATGNTLNVNTFGLTVNDINFDSFDKVNINIPKSFESGGDVLTLSSPSTSLDVDKLRITLDVDSPLTTNNTINILINGVSSSSADADEVDTDKPYISQGALWDYDVDFTTSDDGGITATIGERRESINQTTIADEHQEAFETVKTETPEIFNEMATEQMLGDDESSSKEDSSSENDEVQLLQSNFMVGGFGVFMNTGGGKIKTKTGGGTHITTKNGSYNLGLARSIESQKSSLYIAPIFEYVKGSYDSTMENNIHGEGDSRYVAGGFMARQLNKSGMYYEGSLRAGRVKNDFSSNDFMISGEKTHVNYDMSAPVFASHVRVGNLNRMNKDNLLEVYGMYSYTRQGSMSTVLSTGDHIHFNSVQSHSFRVGYKLTSRVSRISRIYTGLAYQYDTNSDSTANADASANTPAYSKTTSGMSGSSGILELGWQIKPMKSSPWMLDIKTIGWFGKHQGFNATAKVQKSF